LERLCWVARKPGCVCSDLIQPTHHPVSQKAPAMSDILHHTEGGVLTLTFNRLEKKNSISQAMYAELAQQVNAANTRADVRVALIQGHESIFCSGNDIADFLGPRISSEDAPVFQFLRAIASFQKPLLAAVAGPAVGIGTTLLFHCDLVYAGDNAAFSMPFVNLGLCPEAASSLLAPRLMGYQRAAEALLMGEPFFAEAALEVGLVNRVLPPAEVNGYAQAQAKKLSAKPLASLMETKRLMKLGSQDAVLARIRDEAVVFGRMLGEGAAKEALTAFMEKRRPDFANF
jgi:enoyl-CoA hydratase/carnithine racemase